MWLLAQRKGWGFINPWGGSFRSSFFSPMSRTIQPSEEWSASLKNNLESSLVCLTSKSVTILNALLVVSDDFIISLAVLTMKHQIVTKCLWHLPVLHDQLFGVNVWVKSDTTRQNRILSLFVHSTVYAWPMQSLSCEQCSFLLFLEPCTYGEPTSDLSLCLIFLGVSLFLLPPSKITTEQFWTHVTEFGQFKSLLYIFLGKG